MVHLEPQFGRWWWAVSSLSVVSAAVLGVLVRPRCLTQLPGSSHQLEWCWEVTVVPQMLGRGLVTCSWPLPLCCWPLDPHALSRGINSPSGVVPGVILFSQTAQGACLVPGIWSSFYWKYLGYFHFYAPEPWLIYIPTPQCPPLPARSGRPHSPHSDVCL